MANTGDVRTVLQALINAIAEEYNPTRSQAYHDAEQLVAVADAKDEGCKLVQDLLTEIEHDYHPEKTLAYQRVVDFLAQG